MKKLLSWGRFPNTPQQAEPCVWRDDLPAQFLALAQKGTGLLAYGNGRSYGDSCLAEAGTVLHLRSLKKFIQVDWQRGVIVAEAGVTLAEIIDIALPNGWFLPVTPGTKYATLGGAIANDVHGKNHHVRGTFGCHIKSFSLIRSDNQRLICSAMQNPALYEATIGGLGLSGIIEWAELQLMPVQSSFITSEAIKFSSLSEFFTLSAELDSQHEYSVAWVDCLASGKALGRGIYFVGDHCQSGDLINLPGRSTKVPFELPFSMINGLSLRAFNTLYFHKQLGKSVYSHSYYDPFFYPLDGIQDWNRIYGRKGFQQFQCVVPRAVAEPVMTELLSAIVKAGRGSFLAVLKCCGDIASPGLLSFPLPGVSLALDFPNNQDCNRALFAILDTIVRAAGGRLYPAKDAHMNADDFRVFYPQWEAVEALRDPAICSTFWKRVALS